MLSPIGWIKPRLKSLCVAFGAADMTLIVLSTICWYFFFNVGFEAQHLHSLYKQQNKKNSGDEEDDLDDEDGDVIYKLKEERTPEDLRLSRTIRACALPVTNNDLDTNSIDANYAGPAAFIGASMGSFFILGALLCSLNVVDHPAARRVICAVALFGQSVSCFFLLIGVISLLTNDGLCPTEYYYEFFQPVMYLVVFTLIFISTYKAYEMTILAFYMGDQSTELNQEKRTIKRLSGGGTGTLESDLKKLRLSVQAQAGQGDSSMPQNKSKRKSGNTHNYAEGEGAEEGEMKIRPNTATDNSADAEGMESRRRRRKSREEEAMKNRPETATATDNSTRNPGGDGEGSESKRKSRSRDREQGGEAKRRSHSRDREQGGEGKRRSHSRDREEGGEPKRRSHDEGRHGRSGERSKSKGRKEGAGGDEESEIKRKQRLMEIERLKREGASDRRGMRPETPEAQADEHRAERRRKHTTLSEKDKAARGDRAESSGHKKKRQPEEYNRDWEREAKKANRRHPAGIPQGGGGESEAGDGANLTKALVPD